MTILATAILGFSFGRAYQKALILNPVYTPAVVAASREAFGGIDYAELRDKCDRAALLDFANSLLQLTYSHSQDELVTEIDNKLSEFNT